MPEANHVYDEIYGRVTTSGDPSLTPLFRPRNVGVSERAGVAGRGVAASSAAFLSASPTLPRPRAPVTAVPFDALHAPWGRWSGVSMIAFHKPAPAASAPWPASAAVPPLPLLIARRYYYYARGQGAKVLKGKDFSSCYCHGVGREANRNV